MSRPEHYQEGMELISGLLDGSISESDFDRLHVLLEGDPKLRQLYMQSVDQDVELSYRPAVPPRLIEIPLYRFAPLALLAAAAIVLSLLLIWNFLPPSGENGGQTPVPIVEAPETRQSRSEPPIPPEPVPEPPPPSPPQIAAQRPVPAAPETWIVDFESGLPTGWDAEFASADLPAGSKGAVRTITKVSDESGTSITYRNITPPMAWRTGHFTIRDDSHLHLTFKVETTGDFDIFMMTHSPHPDRSDGMMYKFDDGRLWAEEGKWQKVSIPLAAFMGKDSDKGKFVDNLPPTPGEVAWQLFFSAANNDLQMVIDEIRVDREGPGEFVIEPLETRPL